MNVDSNRLQRDLATMARFTAPGSRPSLDPAACRARVRGARSWLREEMARYALRTRLDVLPSSSRLLL